MPCGGLREPSAEVRSVCFHQNQAGPGGVVAQAYAGRRQSFARRFEQFSGALKEFDRAADGSNLVEGDSAGAIDAHGRLAGIEDRGFDAMRGWAGVKNGVDAAVEIVQDVSGGGWADVAEEIGAGRGHRDAGLSNEHERDRMRRHADADERAAGSDVVRDKRTARQQKRKWAGPERPHETTRHGRNIVHKRFEH